MPYLTEQLKFRNAMPTKITRMPSNLSIRFYDQVQFIPITKSGTGRSLAEAATAIKTIVMRFTTRIDFIFVHNCIRVL